MGVYLRGKSWYIDFYYEGKRYTEKVGKVAKSVAEEKLVLRGAGLSGGSGNLKRFRFPLTSSKRNTLNLPRETRSLNPHCRMNAY
jgi:hypothetical protein